LVTGRGAAARPRRGSGARRWPAPRRTGRSCCRPAAEAFFNDEAHLLDFVSKKLGALKGVTGAETSLILKVAKFSYEWGIP
jgi:hypothetical protein